MRGNSHVRFGGGRRGNHRLRSRHRRLAAYPARPLAGIEQAPAAPFRQDEDRQASAERDQRADRPGFHENEILARLDPLTKRRPVRETCSASGPSIRLGISPESPRVGRPARPRCQAASSQKHLRTRVPYVAGWGSSRKSSAARSRSGVGAAGTGARAASGFAPPLSAFCPRARVVGIVAVHRLGRARRAPPAGAWRWSSWPPAAPPACPIPRTAPVLPMGPRPNASSYRCAITFVISSRGLAAGGACSSLGLVSIPTTLAAARRASASVKRLYAIAGCAAGDRKSWRRAGVARKQPPGFPSSVPADFTG